MTGVCTSPSGKISASPAELLDPTLLHGSGVTLILRIPLHSKLTFWKAKTEYGVELCSNHQRYAIPTPPNQQWNSSTLFPADNHSRFCIPADLPSSPLVLKPSVRNFTCWGLGEHPQSGNEPVWSFLSLNSMPLPQVCTSTTQLRKRHLNPGTVPAGVLVPKTYSVFCSLSFPDQ